MWLCGGIWICVLKWNFGIKVCELNEFELRGSLSSRVHVIILLRATVWGGILSEVRSLVREIVKSCVNWRYLNLSSKMLQDVV